MGNIGLWLAQEWQNAEARKNVSRHQNVASSRLVIPVKGETKICSASPIGGDGVETVQRAGQMIGVSSVDVLYAEIVNDEKKNRPL